MKTTLDQAKNLWLYNGVVADGFRLENGEIVEGETITKADLFKQYAPQFNFELDADQLVAEGLKRGFITKIGEDLYQINNDYGQES